MADRHLLLKRDLEKFKKFITKQGWRIEPEDCNIGAQILRARHKDKQEMCIVYMSKDPYFSVFGESERLALEFYNL